MQDVLTPSRFAQNNLSSKNTTKAMGFQSIDKSKAVGFESSYPIPISQLKNQNSFTLRVAFLYFFEPLK